MASLERDRWWRFALNATRYALGPIGGLLVPWLVVQRSSLETWGNVVPTLIMIQLMLHVGQWGSKEFLLKRFAQSDRDPRTIASESLLTRGLVMLPIAAIVAWAGTSTWAIAALWFGTSFVFQGYEAVLIWRKHFTGLFIADLLALTMQVVFLFFAPLTVDRIMLGYLMGAIMRLAVLRWIFWEPSSAYRMDQAFEMRVSFNDHFLDALPFFLIGLSGLLASRIDLYTANALLDGTHIGRYQIVTSLFLQFQAGAAIVAGSLTRDLYRMSSTSVSRYARRMRTWAAIGLPIACIISWVVFTQLFAFDLPLSAFVAGCALVWPVYAYVPMINQLYKRHRERSVLWANLAAAALSCTLTAALLPRMGVTGGLLAAAAGQWLMLAWMKIEERRLHALSAM